MLGNPRSRAEIYDDLIQLVDEASRCERHAWIEYAKTLLKHHGVVSRESVTEALVRELKDYATDQLLLRMSDRTDRHGASDVINAAARNAVADVVRNPAGYLRSALGELQAEHERATAVSKMQRATDELRTVLRSNHEDKTDG